MKNIGININANKDPNEKILKEILNCIDKDKYNTYIFRDSKKINNMASELDIVISIGGDGTILRTARILAKYSVPIIGINFGNLGFLTTAESNELKKALSELFAGKYFIEERMMIQCILRDNKADKEIISLNDIVISKGALSRVINYNMNIDGHYYNNIIADGIILSTPTGSTAYSLSAGGPIIYPTLDLISITPICPLSLNMRSMILDSNSQISIKFDEKNESVFLTVDGQEAFELNSESEIIIKKSKYKSKLIRLEGHNYFETLRKKIMLRINKYEEGECK
ncbi:NAD(+)/NADH kinase [Haloimpatiens sp. FM7330]|uniref:NAD(+)/NADH kinase n=1 Tax=Haloimpatiens sp. FM7330 TaxID=3298610 RepID=UPI003644C138